jgi:hypothetical protein
MFNKILPFLNKYIPKDIAAKGLSKVDKNFGKYIAASTAAGYTLDEVLDFLRNQSGFGDKPPTQNPYRGDMNLQEKASLRNANQPNDVGKVLKTLGAGAGALAGVGGLIGLPENEEGQPVENQQQAETQKPAYDQDFLKYLRHLIKNGTVEESDDQTIDNFWRYWKATEGKKRSSPFVEFEKFRVGTSDFLNIPKKEEQQQGGLNPSLAEALKKVQQALQG